MDWKSFIAEVIGHMAWPVAFIVTITILKEPIVKLLSLVSRLKYKDLDIEFSKAVKELRKEAEKLTPDIESKDKDSKSIVQLAELAPRAAVIEAWRRLEAEAIEALERADAKTPGIKLRSGTVWRALLNEKLIDQNRYNMIMELSSLRNTAVHADEFSFNTDDAIDYIFSVSPQVTFLKSQE